MSSRAAQNEAETKPIRVLRMLADAPEGLASAAFADLYPHAPSRQRMQHLANEILKRHAQLGRVTRGDVKRYESEGGKKPHPSYVWYITPAGRAAISRHDQAEFDRAAAEQAHAEAERSAAARRAAVAAALCDAAGRYSRATPRRTRIAVGADLKTAGCTNVQIASVFGVSRQLIHLDQTGKTSGRPGERRTGEAR
jgi:hypothetical protein